MVAAVVYALVPSFVPVLARLGDDMPLSARILVTVYRFAVVLPLAMAAAGWLRPQARLLVPVAYLIAAGAGIFLLLVLYVAMFELS